ncbi:acetyl esterase/lipase [Variovorax sp. PvP013]
MGPDSRTPSMTAPLLSPRLRLLAPLALGAAAALSACSPARLVNGLVPSDTYRFEGGVAYGATPRQKLDVYRPLPASVPADGRKPPLVVFFHGGSWTHGDRAAFRFVGEALAARGAVVAIPDYGLSPAFRYPTFVRDSALAVKWALDNAERLGADPRRVHVMGHSSGAYNAAMVALDGRWLAEVGAQPKQLAGWIGMAGPYDFLPIDDPEARVAFDWPATPPDSQPYAHAGADAPRTLLMAARDDRTVDTVRNTDRLARRLRAAGVDVRTESFDGLGHVTLIGAVARPLQWIGEPVLPSVTEFLGLPMAKR